MGLTEGKLMGRVFVVGAGVSKCADYPLGIELFDEIDLYIKSCGPCYDGFDYRKDWKALKLWLQRHRNPLISEAYRKRLIEYLFSLLDIAHDLQIESLISVYRSLRGDETSKRDAEQNNKRYARNVRAYPKYRRVLLLALRAYLLAKHEEDIGRTGSWTLLRDFASRLRLGDTIITFNYDVTLERMLWLEKLWTPKNGFGFDVEFQHSKVDSTSVLFADSGVRVLHMHGCIGWYGKDLAPGPRETRIALHPEFLRRMNIDAVDVAMPETPIGPIDEQSIVLHPSFLKDYELHEQTNLSLIRLWQEASAALRNASAIYIIGYSLPRADSAALTLLITSCERNKVTIINRNKQAYWRLRKLLSKQVIGSPADFQSFVATL